MIKVYVAYKNISMSVNLYSINNNKNITVWTALINLKNLMVQIDLHRLMLNRQ
ncbi:hypothetical protein SAMN04488691_105113 [Haloferax larsenii]|uniref:Uncharacterized protein n=1 Tax=Haloferax larsenii TaxID=302484 RepID=A0A1H7QRS6_HALLR|nr:hypothetical protein SAMN04488691_105113 [Haloferax larsenii]